MEENNELAELEELLCADLEVENKKKNNSTLRDVDIFKNNENIEEENKDKSAPFTSTVHNGDTDSSDDEEKRNYTERKYNDYGASIKKTLDDKELEERHIKLDFETRLRETNRETKVARNTSFVKKPELSSEHRSKYIFAPPASKVTGSVDIYTDPIFGIRITKPLISSAALLERMQGREAVNMLRVKRYVENEDLTKDWVIAGVIVRKSGAKKSQKGNNFSIWTLSDLKDDLKTVSMFLFRKAYNDLWITSEGTVVAVLNPNVLDKSQNNTDQACLSVENPERVMILGQSKDLGVCKSRKKNGEPCTAFVNISQCEHCVYHVKQEYHKYSKRQELQSPTMGKGLVNLRNKVLGKDTVIYGGKAFTALPTGNSKKVKEKDQNRLMSLTDYFKTEDKNLMMNKAPYGAGSIKNNSTTLHSPTTKKLSDFDRLNKLSNVNSSPTNLTKSSQSNSGSNLGLSSLCSQSSSLAQRIASSPKLGKGFSLKGSGTIDLNISYGEKRAERAKANAIKLIQQNGGLTKANPNNIKGTEAGKKRALEKLNISNENVCKKPKTEVEIVKSKGIMSERFKKILEATSSHQNLIEQHEDDEQEKYFNKLEKKEAMEEKMLSTFKLPCKAVRCVKCKYTAFSAAQRCKDEGHPMKLLEAFKRFFKCLDCNNRTVSLELIPLHSCSNCSSSRWEKAPMLREKKVAHAEGLSIRGEEETFIGGCVTAGKNINLLVPES